MNISLEQAIEIHARALLRRLDCEAPASAREKAADLRRIGDREGQKVWLAVAAAAERLLTESRAAPAPEEKQPTT